MVLIVVFDAKTVTLVVLVVAIVHHVAIHKLNTMTRAFAFLPGSLEGGLTVREESSLAIDNIVLKEELHGHNAVRIQ